MDMTVSGLRFAKPEPRKRTKGRKDRAASLVVQRIRALCVERDGDCRYAKDHNGDTSECRGQSEWAHFGAHRRARTRGQSAEKRHTTAGSLQLCTRHHTLYDSRKMEIVALIPPAGCDGDLLFYFAGGLDV